MVACNVLALCIELVLLSSCMAEQEYHGIVHRVNGPTTTETWRFTDTEEEFENDNIRAIYDFETGLAVFVLKGQTELTDCYVVSFNLTEIETPADVRKKLTSTEPVCCNDEKHCCPSGTTCDAPSGKCNNGDTQIDWFEKQPVLKINAQGVQCDSTHQCPDGNTCCQLSSGEWGCCPLPNAVCCSDKTRCCPSGTTCDTESGKCSRGYTKIDWLDKQPVLKIKEHGVQCDSTHECPDENTCCNLSSGEWGCCPLPNAVCCIDETRCCPRGTTCDIGSGKCSRGYSRIDLFKKQPVLKIMEQRVECDSTHKCPDRNTCCKLSSGEWGCCPLPIAVCCSDGIHCCPGGTTCDTGSGKCQRGNTRIDWLDKQPVLKIKEHGVRCDSTHECPDGNTCCKLRSGEWGCCPLPNFEVTEKVTIMKNYEVTDVWLNPNALRKRSHIMCDGRHIFFFRSVEDETSRIRKALDYSSYYSGFRILIRR